MQFASELFGMMIILYNYWRYHDYLNVKMLKRMILKWVEFDRMRGVNKIDRDVESMEEKE